MIGKVKGKLISLENNLGLVETVIGLSYYIFLPPAVIGRTKINDKLEVYTYYQVREDAHTLFGFESKAAYDFFCLLLTVPGVGPKTAFNIMSKSQIDEIIKATTNNDITYFTNIPGLGKKTGLKIILELSQKLKTEFKFQNISLSEEDKTVIDALIALGFPGAEARRIFYKLPANLSLQDKIKSALKFTKTKII